MRRMLHVLKWIGLSLSTLLLAAIFVLWVRSLEHEEQWVFARFESRPEWTALDPAGTGIRRWWYTEASHGRLWLGSGTLAPAAKFESGTQYRRGPIPAERAEAWFDSVFPPHERKQPGGTDRTWRFAGAGFNHIRSAVDSRIGQPNVESSSLALPFWMLAVVFGLWPVGFVAWRLLRKKRHAPGHCTQCGYDLRATPDPAGPLLPRCPECGRETAAAQPAQTTPR